MVRLRHVTAIFSILMRLRQAVLHPTLVLKRLKENLAAKGKSRLTADNDDSAPAAGELDEAGIQKLIERYAATKDGGSTIDILDGLLEPKEEGDPLENDTESLLCMEVCTSFSTTSLCC